MSTSTLRSAYHHGDLKTALVQAALDLLEQDGGGGPTLRAAARLAGVSAMAPYRHFADGDALLAAVAARGFDMLAERLEAADRQALPQEALAAQGAAYVTFACERPGLFRLMFRGATLGVHKSLAEAGSRAYRVLEQRVAGMVPEETRKDATLAAWSLVHGLAALITDRKVDPGGESPSRLAERITRLMIRALPTI